MISFLVLCNMKSNSHFPRALQLRQCSELLQLFQSRKFSNRVIGQDTLCTSKKVICITRLSRERRCLLQDPVHGEWTSAAFYSDVVLKVCTIFPSVSNALTARLQRRISGSSDSSSGCSQLMGILQCVARFVKGSSHNLSVC